jgi:hypothetical protein
MTAVVGYLTFLVVGIIAAAQGAREPLIALAIGTPVILAVLWEEYS